MRVLAIESSCDETGVAIYDSEQGLLSHALYSQIEMHAIYGGVVPELASRDHIRKSIPLIKQALKEANCSLSELTLDKTLRESEFYFPMESASSQKLSQMLTEHRRTGGLLANKTSIVRLPHYQSLKGMMHGFIDLVFEHQGQYFVCDYKSSHLGDHFDDYKKEQLQANIENNYYDLQYLIYSLALHRHLKHSLENYDPAIHFGGIYYFYLRGMTDDEHHKDSGIYYRKILTEELEQLDQIFSGSKPRQVQTVVQESYSE